jgi:hypothetical protein
MSVFSFTIGSDIIGVDEEIMINIQRVLGKRLRREKSIEESKIVILFFQIPEKPLSLTELSHLMKLKGIEGSNFNKNIPLILQKIKGPLLSSSKIPALICLGFTMVTFHLRIGNCFP